VTDTYLQESAASTNAFHLKQQLGYPGQFDYSIASASGMPLSAMPTGGHRPAAAPGRFCAGNSATQVTIKMDGRSSDTTSPRATRKTLSVLALSRIFAGFPTTSWSTD